MEGNLKETELRLGPPSPVREKANGVEDSATSSATSELSLLSQHPEKKLFVDEEEKQPPQNGGGFWSSGIVGNKASGAKRGFAQTIDVGKMRTWGFGTEKPNVLPIESGKNNNNGGILTSPKAGSVGLWSSDHHGSFLSGSRTNGQVGSGGVNNLNGSGSRVDASRESVTQKMEVSAQKPIPSEDRPAPKAQVVGWPPIRSFRKNSLAPSLKPTDESESKPGSSTLYVKVSMDGAPYLRKVDLKLYSKYQELSSALENMFSGFTVGPYGANGAQGRDGLSESKLKDLLNGSEYVLTYEDKDGDWMLVGDVPWEMFVDSCKRMRIMKSSEAIGLAPRAMEKCKNRS